MGVIYSANSQGFRMDVTSIGDVITVAYSTPESLNSEDKYTLISQAGKFLIAHDAKYNNSCCGDDIYLSERTREAALRAMIKKVIRDCEIDSPCGEQFPGDLKELEIKLEEKLLAEGTPTATS